MKNHYYQAGVHYQAFMLRALKTINLSTRKGTSSSIYQKLINMENGTAFGCFSYSKQLKTVKSHLHKGFDTLLKRNIVSWKKAH